MTTVRTMADRKHRRRLVIFWTIIALCVVFGVLMDMGQAASRNGGKGSYCTQYTWTGSTMSCSQYVTNVNP